MYKVLITTSGIGSRLKHLTKNKNKSLVKIGDKAVIDYIIRQYPENVELVLTIGYKGEGVKNYVQKKYPYRKITFVKVDKFDGPGSSLGYSMLQAKKYLQCPFVFHCNDTIVLDPIPSPEKFNWNGGSKGNDPQVYNTVSYSSFSVKGNKMTKMNRKGAIDWDLFHIGLVGIKDYEVFWKYLEKAYYTNPNDTTLNDCVSIIAMLNAGKKFIWYDFPHWYDTGNLTVLAHTEKLLGHS